MMERSKQGYLQRMRQRRHRRNLYCTYMFPYIQDSVQL